MFPFILSMADGRRTTCDRLLLVLLLMPVFLLNLVMVAETRLCLSAASCSCTDNADICHGVSRLPDGRAYRPGVKPQTADFRESALSMVELRRFLTQYQSVHDVDIRDPSYPTNCFNLDAVEKLFPTVTIRAPQCDSFVVNRDPDHMKKTTKKPPENWPGTSPAQNTPAKTPPPRRNDVVTTTTPAETSLRRDDIVLTMSPHTIDAPARQTDFILTLVMFTLYRNPDGSLERVLSRCWRCHQRSRGRDRLTISSLSSSSSSSPATVGIAELPQASTSAEASSPMMASTEQPSEQSHTKNPHNAWAQPVSSLHFWKHIHMYCYHCNILSY